MGRQVTIIGDRPVALPDGRVYQPTDTALLTDEQWARISPTAIGTRVQDDGSADHGAAGTLGDFVDVTTAGANPGDVLTLNAEGDEWGPAPIGASAAVLHVRDERPSGTNGGTFTNNAWRTRTLNTIETNEIEGVSVNADQITLPSGDYEARWWCVAVAVNTHKTRLYDTTGAATLISGGNAVAVSPSGASTSKGVGRFTLANESVLELQHRGSTSATDFGFGFAASFGDVEVYLDLEIIKLA